MTEPNDARRLAHVAAAQQQWIDALTDLGGRNTLLYFKDRRAGTLDLAAADPDAVERFEKSSRARLTQRFPGGTAPADMPDVALPYAGLRASARLKSARAC
jgi:hypothetical protein